MDDSKREAKMKIKSEHRDYSSSDSDTAVSDIRCNICNLHFSTVKAYNVHVKSKKHKKTADETEFISKLTLSDKEKTDESDDEDFDSNAIYCDVCDKYMSGYIPYMTHMKGSPHAKNLRKHKLKKGMMGMPEIMDKENEEIGDDDELLQKVFAYCSRCQKSFSGPEPFHMHLKSAAHKKKELQSKTLEDLKAKHPDEANKSDDEDYFSKCSVCDKSFSGIVPYKIHMQSNVHKKNLEKVKLAEEIKDFFSTADNAYICRECNKKFSDPKNFKHHLTNNSHEKLKAKKALSEFLSSNPEIVFLTSFRYKDSDDDIDSDSSDEDYYLVCKLCHVSFSGPESAEDHVKSKSHINLKKQSKMLKILKKQNNGVNNSSNVDKTKVFQDNDTVDEEKKRVRNDDPKYVQANHSRKCSLSSEDYEYEMV